MPTDPSAWNFPDKDNPDIWYVPPKGQEQHKPVIRTTVTLIFPNLGSATINDQVSGLVSHAMRCGAKETYVTIVPEDEEDDA